ncbi:MAG: ABC transporter ATP-binding protein [Candidatus Micrarchaeia archaeon]
MEVIKAEGISKSYKVYETRSSGFLASWRRKYLVKKVLDKVSFSVQSGEIVALLGRNGSGKSTLIKILTGIVSPDKGTATVLGFDPWKERMKLAYDIGVVLGAHTQVNWDLPAYDTFNFMRKIYKIPKATFNKNLHYFVNLLDLGQVYRKPVRTLSLGEQMKCNFVASMLHLPKVVFLDEPTIGVDIISKTQLKKAMLNMRSRYGTTFFLTTHIVEDISIADRVIILHKSRIAFDGTRDKLSHMFGDKRILEIKFLPGSRIDLGIGKVIYKGVDTARLEVSGKLVKSKKFADFLANSNISDYSVSELGLNELLTKLYNRLDGRV